MALASDWRSYNPSSAIMEGRFRWRASQDTGRHSGSNYKMAHLLIIDDHSNTLASLARAFRMAGHEAPVCHSAVPALDLIKAQRFDLLFSDVVIPRKAGISFLEGLRG